MALTIDEQKDLIRTDEHRQQELMKTTGELKDGMHTACVFLNTEGAGLWRYSNIIENLGTAGLTLP